MKKVTDLLKSVDVTTRFELFLRFERWDFFGQNWGQMLNLGSSEQAL